MFLICVCFMDTLWRGTSLPGAKAASEPPQQLLNSSREVSAAFQHMAHGLLLSCNRDAQVMINLAEKHDLFNHALKAHFLWFNVSADLFRYQSTWDRRAAAAAEGTPTERITQEERAALVQRSVDERTKCTQRFQKAINALALEQKDNPAFTESFGKIRGLADQVLETWAHFEKQSLVGEWYEEVTLEEKQAILRAVLEKEYSEFHGQAQANSRHGGAHVPVSQWPHVLHWQRGCIRESELTKVWAGRGRGELLPVRCGDRREQPPSPQRQPSRRGDGGDCAWSGRGREPLGRALRAPVMWNSAR
jgi:hypothetical protein